MVERTCLSINLYPQVLIKFFASCILYFVERSYNQFKLNLVVLVLTCIYRPCLHLLLENLPIENHKESDLLICWLFFSASAHLWQLNNGIFIQCTFLIILHESTIHPHPQNTALSTPRVPVSSNTTLKSILQSSPKLGPRESLLQSFDLRQIIWLYIGRFQ